VIFVLLSIGDQLLDDSVSVSYFQIRGLAWSPEKAGDWWPAIWEANQFDTS